MKVVESAVQFDCEGERLVGVFSQPTEAPPDDQVAVLIIVGGPQYRAGAHRQFVQLARALASAGHAVLRFDQRGNGDSTGDARSFTDISPDVGCAVDALRWQAPQARRLVLLGLCDGASAALLYLQDGSDQRIDALCLLNPWARSEATLARTHIKHYYANRLTDADFWRKLLRGEVGRRRIGEFLRSLRAGFVAKGRRVDEGRELVFQDAMAEAWRHFGRPILLVLSGEDLTAREFLEYASAAADWRGLVELGNVELVRLSGADHTLSDPADQLAFEQAVKGWLVAARPRT
jgi:exosortase A-associated hydrolase 1